MSGQASRKYEDLFEVVGHLPMDGFNPRTYWEWEQEVAEPALNDAGYSVQGWGPGETDSFGPLTRVVTVLKDGELRYLVYG